MDVNSALRACPICRKLSYLVIPSVIWYSSKEEKQDIVDSYKAKHKSIDCKHFDFGNGNCPFGSSCFYKHKVKPGSYTRRHHKPPPQRSSFVDDLFDMFNSIEELTASETALDPMEELTSLEMALLLRDLILDTSDSSSDEEDFYSP